MAKVARRRQKKLGKMIIDPDAPAVKMVIRFLGIFLATIVEHWLDAKK
jgi:hypothetical protein